MTYTITWPAASRLVKKSLRFSLTSLIFLPSSIWVDFEWVKAPFLSQTIILKTPHYIILALEELKTNVRSSNWKHTFSSVLEVLYTTTLPQPYDCQQNWFSVRFAVCINLEAKPTLAQDKDQTCCHGGKHTTRQWLFWP